jgi:hypothetical protein
MRPLICVSSVVLCFSDLYWLQRVAGTWEGLVWAALSVCTVPVVLLAFAELTNE